MEAEKEKAQCEENHKKRAAKFAEFESQKILLEKKYAKSIKKARPYFQLKEEMGVKLKVYIFNNRCVNTKYYFYIHL